MLINKNKVLTLNFLNIHFILLYIIPNKNNIKYV